MEINNSQVIMEPHSETQIKTLNCLAKTVCAVWEL